MDEGAEPLMESDPWIGRTINDRYRVESLLGQGGMGSVYVAEHLKLGKRVAFKVIHPEFYGAEDIAERFAREALASGKLDHPHVASALDFGSLPEGGAYLVLQLVQGPSLQDVIEQSAGLSVFETCTIGAQIADALAAAHGQEIVHRDLKPENVLLDGQHDGPWARVLDFGIARTGRGPLPSAGGVEKPAQRPLTAVGTIVGTPGYMAPEQALGQVVDARADLYSLGVVLWEMLTGDPLFGGNNLTAVVTRQLTEKVESPGSLTSCPIPVALDELILRLLEPQAADRPDLASEVRDALREMARVEAAGGSQENALPDHTAPAKTVDVHAETQQVWTADTLSNTAPAPAALARPDSGSPGTSWLTAKAPRIANTPWFVWVAVGLGGFVLANLALLAVWTWQQPSQPQASDDSATTLVAEMPKDDGSGLVAPVAAGVRTLLHARSRLRSRRQAAQWLLRNAPPKEVPRWALLVAELEAARGCQEKRAKLGPLIALADARTRPALERIARAPRRGCGFLNLGDCYDCMRDDVTRALAIIPAHK